MEVFQNCCRLCLTREGTLFHISDAKRNFYRELSACLSINIAPEDKLPKQICSKCANTLRDCYTFYVDAKRCEKLLVTLIQSNSAKESSPTKESSKALETLYLTEFSDDGNEFNDVLLPDDSDSLSAFECLEEEDSESNITQALLQSGAKLTKIANVVKKDESDSYEIHMEIDVLDSDLEIVNEILARESQNGTVEQRENYSCMSCKAVFCDFELLVKHMETCDSLKSSCAECGERFKTKTQMQKHLLTHKAFKAHVCKECLREFSQEDELEEHVRENHPDVSDNVNCIYRCKKCGVVFKSKHKLYAHVKSHIKSTPRSKSEKFSCSECDKGFSDLDQLQVHIRSKHINGAKVANPPVYRCKLCSVFFLDKTKLYSHIKQHTDALGEGQHLCDSCGRSFNTAKALSRHVQMHKEKHLMCDICSKQFPNTDTLNSHLISHNSAVQMCELCGITLPNEYAFDIHKANNHSVNILS